MQEAHVEAGGARADAARGEPHPLFGEPVDSALVNGAIVAAIAFVAAAILGALFQFWDRPLIALGRFVDRVAGTGPAAGWGLFLVTFLLIFREGVETILILAAVRFTIDGVLACAGGMLGLGMAVLFGVTFLMSFTLAYYFAMRYHGHGEDSSVIAHAAYHGFMTFGYLGMPILVMNFLYERRSWGFILMNLGYWFLAVISLVLVVHLMPGAEIP